MTPSIDLNQPLTSQEISTIVSQSMAENQGDPDSTETTNYPGDACSSSASADAFGSWVEVISDIGNDAVVITEALLYLLTVAVPSFELEIGIGAAASEVTVARAIGKASVGTLSLLVLPVTNRMNRKIAANSRVAVRIKDNVASALDYTCLLKWKKA